MRRIVTIEREYGSGGSLIGKELAKRLNIPFYDRNILEMAAKRMNKEIEYVEHLEESVTNSFLYGLVMSRQNSFDGKLPLSEQLFAEEEKIIREIAQREQCVIVGRCAGPILRKQMNCLTVFVYADKDSKIKRAIEEYSIQKEKVEIVLKQNDKRRGVFFNTNTNKKWGQKESFDLCINSGVLGIEACVDILQALIK